MTPLSADPSLAVVEAELDRRAADRLAIAGAVENHVLHRLAAQRRCFRLAQHPAHGVDDVRLAAAVGPDDADELAGRRDRSRIDERLEPGELDLGETQGLGPEAKLNSARTRQRITPLDCRAQDACTRGPGQSTNYSGIMRRADSSKPATPQVVTAAAAGKRFSWTAWHATSVFCANSRRGTSRRQRSFA